MSNSAALLPKTNLIWLIIKILVAVGAINWGLIGVFNINLVTLLFGAFPAIVKIIYILVGLSGVVFLVRTT